MLLIISVRKAAILGPNARQTIYPALKRGEFGLVCGGGKASGLADAFFQLAVQVWIGADD